MREIFGEVVEQLRRITVQVRTVYGNANRIGSGSGVVWSPEGQIVTNSHVIEGAMRSGVVEVEFWDGRRAEGKIASRDQRRDLALIQVDVSVLASASCGNSDALRVGELVIAVGNPLGFIGAASTGLIHEFTNQKWVVSQLRLAPGNSGGPLANARGELVGINTMISGGLAFAVPSRAVNRFLRNSPQDSGGLGVVVRPVISAGQFGLLVLEVLGHSPADRASLLQGDMLVGAGGKRLRSVEDLEFAIDASRNGILELQFLRGGTKQIRTVVAQMDSSVRAA